MIEFMYALVDKETGKRLSPFKGNSVGLYKTRNGPSQLKYFRRINTEIVKYKVVLERVEDESHKN